MSNLLQKQLRVFTLYALIVLACSIPAYYFIVDHIWLDELDDHNKNSALQTEARLNDVEQDELQQSIALWNKIQPGTTIKQVSENEVKPDSFYEVMRQNADVPHPELERFRGLSKYIRIHGKPYHLSVETNIEEAEETIAAIAVITFLFFLILVGGFVLLNRWLAARVWKPFHQTLAKLRTFDLNNQEQVEFDRSAILEFEELNTALDKLITKNISTYKEQKEFTENASHELQTPMAVIQSKLDLMLQQDALTKAQYELIEEITKALSRASRINKNLLLLAKIENRQFADQEQIDLSMLLSDNLGSLAEHIESKGLSVTKEIGQGVMIAGNRMLVELLITNLLLNAIRHNTSNGKIIIHLSAEAFSVSNSGTIPLKEGGLFKRFVSTAKDGSGSGLGLAIAKQICDRYNWKMDYHFENDLHIFSVKFE